MAWGRAARSSADIGDVRVSGHSALCRGRVPRGTTRNSECGNDDIGDIIERPNIMPYVIVNQASSSPACQPVNEGVA